MPASLIALIVLAAAFSIGLPWFIHQNTKRRRAALDELQTRNNWIIEEKDLPGTGTGVLKYRVRAPQEAWEVHCTSINRGGSSSTTGTEVEFSQPWEGARDGLFIVGPPMSTQGMEFLGTMMGGLIVQALAKSIGLPAEHMANLELQKTDAPVTAMATPQAVSWVNLATFADTVKLWTSRYKGEKMHPILLLGDGKFRVRVRSNFSRPKDLEAFVLLALTLRRAAEIKP